VFLNRVQYPHQFGLGDYQGITIHEEESMLVTHVFGGKQDI
jgi:hypothetical protein